VNISLSGLTYFLAQVYNIIYTCELKQILGGAGVAETKKIILSLPNSLLEEVDGIAAIEKKNRSEFIREAMRLYIREREKKHMREVMKKGYLEMAKINIALAEMAFYAENDTYTAYETQLAECE
jgi:CopG family transcriptional regulator/antitoxin EndoAI